MATYADLIARARVILQDADKTRYSDAEMLDALNQALGECYRIRPDFWVGNYSNNPVEVTDTSATVAYVPVWAYTDVVFMVAGFAELRDDEHVEQGRALALINSARVAMRGG